MQLDVSGVDDLLENTHRALGLTLKRGEAAALISMLDANGDNCIQCEELEVRIAYRVGGVSCRFFFIAPSALKTRLGERPLARGPNGFLLLAYQPTNNLFVYAS